MSAARANSVVLALAAACPWQHAGTMAIGLGEAPARKAGLDNPHPEPDGRSAFEHAHRDQVVQWPRWRRVDLTVSGRVVVKGYEVQ